MRRKETSGHTTRTDTQAPAGRAPACGVRPACPTAARVASACCLGVVGPCWPLLHCGSNHV
eukprot:11142575-Lingulodinium_polyedra.AAC.1